MRIINLKFYLLTYLLAIVSVVVVIGQTVTVSIEQVGNNVVFCQQGSLNYFPLEGFSDYFLPCDGTTSRKAENIFDAGFHYDDWFTNPFKYIGMEVAVENYTAWQTYFYPFNVSFACISDNNANASEISLPEDTGGFQSVGFGDLPYIFVASDYILGEPMAGHFTVPDTTLEQLILVEGETCYFEFPVDVPDEPLQRIEFVVGSSTTTTPLCPTKSPTTSPTTSPTMTTTTTMSPTTIAPRRERLRNRIENIPIFGPMLLRFLDAVNIFN